MDEDRKINMRAGININDFRYAVLCEPSSNRSIASGAITDVNMDGITFRCFDYEKPIEESFRIGIIWKDEHLDIVIPEIPCKVISCQHENDKTAGLYLSSVTTLVGIRFENLRKDQREGIDRIVRSLSPNH